MLTVEGHERAKAKGGSREPKATNRHNNWKAGIASYEGRRQKSQPGKDDPPKTVA